MSIRDQIGDGWYTLMEKHLKSDDFKELGKFIRKRRSGFNTNVFPDQKDIFKAFKSCPLETLKCVVIGYEPYGLKCDNGIAFGYNGDGPLPKPLTDMFNIWEREVWDGLDLMFDYSLKSFPSKGILMLNLALTTENSESHIKEWKGFSSYLLKQLNTHNKDLEYFFWDKRALVAKSLIKHKTIDGISRNPFKEIELLTDIKFK